MTDGFTEVAHSLPHLSSLKLLFPFRYQTFCYLLRHLLPGTVAIGSIALSIIDSFMTTKKKSTLRTEFYLIACCSINGKESGNH